MTRVLGLFTDQKGAGDAVEALAEAGLGVADTYALEDMRAGTGVEPVVPPIHIGHGTGAAAVPPIKTILPDVTLDNETQEYLSNSLREGGVLIVVDPDDEDEAMETRRVLEEMGGKVSVVD